MNELFTARNMLRQCSFQKFTDYLQQNKNKLTSIDYINLLQQSFRLYKKQFIDYIKLFHKYFHDIVFCNVDNGKQQKNTVLSQILKYRKSWELEELIKIDQRILKDFNLISVLHAIDNAYCSNQSKNGYEMVEIIIQKKPDIILDPVNNIENNPLVQSITKQLYDIAFLLLKYQCYILPQKNYSSNQLHYLFKNRFSKKNQTKIIQLSKVLINNKVDIYQKNQQGKTAYDLCNNEMKDQVQKIYKSVLPQRIHHGHSNSGSQKQGQKFKTKNYQKGDKNEGHTNSSNYQKSKGHKYNNEKSRGNKQQEKVSGNHSNGSNNQSQSMSSKNIYNKSKVKSQFGGKDIIKQNNELVRINIQSNNLLNPKDSNVGSNTNLNDSSNVVKIMNVEDLQNQASLIFQRHTQKKEDQYLTQKAEYDKEERVIKEKKSKIVQSQELKYYLKQQICLLTQSIKKENQQKKKNYLQLVAIIRQEIEDIVPQISIQLFGSVATDLHLDSSDIDLVIIWNNTNKLLQFYQVIQIFKKVNEKLSSMKEIIQQTVFLDKASVPIIKSVCTPKYDFKAVDISFQDSQHNGIKSVDLTKKYLDLYPQLNDLMLVLKKFIYQAKLFGPYSGGLSSYGLFLMIVAFIQNQQFKYRSQNTKQYDINLRIAQLLINFLKFYGFNMDYVTQKINVTKPSDITEGKYLKCISYNPQWQNDFPPQPKLVLMDPLDSDNNVGKQTRRIKQIKMAFQLAYISIHTNKRCTNKKNCQNYRRIKGVKMQETRFKQNKRPCCILERMFNCTEKFDLHLY